MDHSQLFILTFILLWFRSKLDFDCHTQVLGYKLLIYFQLTRPRGPILGAKDDVAPISPPIHLKLTVNYITDIAKTNHKNHYYNKHFNHEVNDLPILISLGSNLGGILRYCFTRNY